MTAYHIRALGPADAEAYRRLRLDALRLHPDAFAAAYEDEARLDLAQFAERIAVPGFTRFGGFAPEGLAGLASLQLLAGEKQRHKANLFGMYVDAVHRRTGLAQILVQAVIDAARDGGALVLHLSVTAGNMPAQRLYRRMGFAVYGVERRALKLGERFYDEDLMALRLD